MYLEVSLYHDHKISKNNCVSLQQKFRERIEPNKLKIPKRVLQAIDEELTKLEVFKTGNDFTIASNYLEWLTVFPWGNYRFCWFDSIHILCSCAWKSSMNIICKIWLILFAVVRIVMSWVQNYHIIVIMFTNRWWRNQWNKCLNYSEVWTIYVENTFFKKIYRIFIKMT